MSIYFGFYIIIAKNSSKKNKGQIILKNDNLLLYLQGIRHGN